MTNDELERAREGFSIQYDIGKYRERVGLMKSTIKRINDYNKETVNVLDCWIDSDLASDALSKQIKRYEQKIAELEKKFDEL